MRSYFLYDLLRGLRGELFESIYKKIDGFIAETICCNIINNIQIQYDKNVKFIMVIYPVYYAISIGFYSLYCICTVKLVSRK